MDPNDPALQLPPGSIPPQAKPVVEATPTEIIVGARGHGGQIYRPEVEKKFLDAIKLGLTMTMACEACRVSPSTVYLRAKKDPDFAEALMEARAECAMIDLAIIRRASKKDWRAAMAHLQLTYPETYGRNAREITVSGEQDKAVRIEISMADGAWNPTGDEG